VGLGSVVAVAVGGSIVAVGGSAVEVGAAGVALGAMVSVASCRGACKEFCPR